VTSPAGTAGTTVDVTVTTSAGTSAVVSGDKFSYNVPGPTVTSISPDNGPPRGGTAVTITGTNFTGATAVTFGATPATSFSVISATSIIAIAPPGLTGVVHVSVTTPAGTSPDPVGDQFTYAEPADSLKVRTLQVMVTPIVAQASGQAITGAIGEGTDDGFAAGGAPITASPTGLHFNFAAEQPQQQQQAYNSRTEDPFAALGDGANGKIANAAPPPHPSPAAVVAREWSAWADLRGAGFSDTNPNADMHGEQVNVTAGIGRKLNPDLLVGIVAGTEQFKYDVTSLTGTLSGVGGTVGTYFAWRFAGDLRLDGSLAWSDIGYDASAGTATGSFRGSRWLYAMGLTGNYRFGAVALEPSAKVFLLRESENAWTDSLGTLQAARIFTAGTASTGAKIFSSFPFAAGTTVAPYVGLYGDYHFSTDNALPVAAPPAVVGIMNGLSGRVTAGATLAGAGGASFGLGGELGGLGSNYKVWTGRASVLWPF